LTWRFVRDPVDFAFLSHWHLMCSLEESPRPAVRLLRALSGADLGDEVMRFRIQTIRALVFAVAGLCATESSFAQVHEEVATTCSRTDVAAAISRAAAGDTVVIPAGTCTWTAGVSLQGVHLTARVKGTVTLVHSAGAANLLTITRDRSHEGSISNLTFREGSGSTDGVHVAVNGPGFPGIDHSAVLIHDNHFGTNGAMMRSVLIRTVGGVIVHSNYFTTNKQNDQAITFKAELPADSVSWTSASTWGVTDVTGLANSYVEDNVFDYYYYQAVDPDGNARAVIRHNTFDHSAITSHGADTGPNGARHVEVYDNKFLFTNFGDCSGALTAPLDYLFFIRGGSWVITDNDVPDLNSCAWGNKAEVRMAVLNLRRNSGGYPCWKGGYPAPHQVGRGHNGSSAISEPAYFWNNTGGGSFTSPSMIDSDPDQCGGGPSTYDFIRVNRDFFVNTPKPGYAKFTYPHPRRTPASQRPSNVRLVSQN
jgi:hypothetical protein